MGSLELPLPHRVAIIRRQGLQGSELLSDAVLLTCRGARQGEFSGVCCCAIEAFFLACPLRQALCPPSLPLSPVCQFGSMT